MGLKLKGSELPFVFVGELNSGGQTVARYLITHLHLQVRFYSFLLCLVVLCEDTYEIPTSELAFSYSP